MITINNRPNAKHSLTIADAMLLVATAAVALALARLSWETTIAVYQHDPRNHERALTDVIGWVALTGSIGLLPLYLKKPRRPLRLLARQPGLTASLAVAFSFGLLLINRLWISLMAVIDSQPTFLRFHSFFWYVGDPISIGQTVTVCWLILLVTSNWRPAPNWLDRMGRFWGFVWVVLFFAVEHLRAFRY